MAGRQETSSAVNGDPGLPLTPLHPSSPPRWRAWTSASRSAPRRPARSKRRWTATASPCSPSATSLSTTRSSSPLEAEFGHRRARHRPRRERQGLKSGEADPVPQPRPVGGGHTEQWAGAPFEDHVSSMGYSLRANSGYPQGLETRRRPETDFRPRSDRAPSRFAPKDPQNLHLSPPVAAAENGWKGTHWSSGRNPGTTFSGAGAARIMRIAARWLPPAGSDTRGRSNASWSNTRGGSRVR